jgi:hypothetical protein
MEHNKLKRTVPAGKKPMLKLTRTLVAKIRGVNHATDVVTAMLFANTIGIWVWTRTPMHIYRLVMMGGGFHIVRVV